MYYLNKQCIIYCLQIITAACVLIFNDYFVYSITDNIAGYKLNKEISGFINTILKTIFRDIKDLHSIKISHFIIKLIVDECINIIVEALYLLKNKTYNNIKKRYDTIYLDIDQAVMIVVILCLTIFILMNTIVYHIYFMFLILFLEPNYA